MKKNKKLKRVCEVCQHRRAIIKYNINKIKCRNPKCNHMVEYKI